MATKVLASCLACVTPVYAYQWAQSGGSASRANIFPPSTFNQLEGIITSNIVVDVSEAISESPKLGAPIAPTVTPSLQYTISAAFKLEKPATPVVTTSGQVIIITPTCDIVGLPTPDRASETWSRAAFVSTGEDNPVTGSHCIDLLLDENDNIFHVTGERSENDNDTIAGYSIASSQNSISVLPGFPIITETSMPVIDLYALGALYVPNPGRFWMPSTPLQSNVGVVMAQTGNGVYVEIEMGADNEDHIAGGVAVPDPSSPGSTLAVFMVSGSSNFNYVAPTGIMTAFRSDGTIAWTSSSSSGSVGGLQPPPLYVPGKRPSLVPGSTATTVGRLYSVLTNAAPTQLFCVLTNGNACGGAFPVIMPTQLAGFALGWWYAGALVPLASNPALVARLLYTVDLAATLNPAEPVGCMVALSPVDGTLVDSFCVPRDPEGRQPILNFLATAPVVYLNARGTGMHTAFVVQFDSIILAFDPFNLAAGPLYALDPLTKSDIITQGVDGLSFTASGTLLTAGWRDGQADSEFVVTALVNPIRALPSSGGTNTNAPPLGAGAAAAISITVIGALGAALAFPIYKRGGFDALKLSVSSAIGKFNPSQVRYVSVPVSNSASFKGSGGYGSVSSASGSSESVKSAFSNL